MKYRKKPMVIEATQWFKHGDHPAVVPDPIGHPLHHFFGVHTLEGFMKVTQGDYIITGVVGETYPCKPEIFEMTYELIGETK
jgi:hypothetical protein